MKNKIIIGILGLLIGYIGGVSNREIIIDNTCEQQVIELEHKLDRVDDKKEVFELFKLFIEKIPFEQVTPNNDIKLNN